MSEGTASAPGGVETPVKAIVHALPQADPEHPSAEARAGRRAAKASDAEASPFSHTVLNAGFGVALLLAVASLAMGAYFLYDFLESTKTGVIEFIREHSNKPGQEDLLYLAINARLVMARLALVSCGIFIGMAFGFLGFALFLIGVKGDMDVDASRGKSEEALRLKLARMSPGVFVILCATVLIGLCITHRTDFEYNRSKPVLVPQPAERAGQAAGASDDAERDAIDKALASGTQKKR